MTFTLRCSGPGPHDPPDGVIGTSSVEPTYVVRCGSPACNPPPPEPKPPELDVIRAKGEAVLAGDPVDAFTADETQVLLARLAATLKDGDIGPSPAVIVPDP